MKCSIPSNDLLCVHILSGQVLIFSSSLSDSVWSFISWAQVLLLLLTPKCAFMRLIQDTKYKVWNPINWCFYLVVSQTTFKNIPKMTTFLLTAVFQLLTAYLNLCVQLKYTQRTPPTNLSKSEILKKFITQILYSIHFLPSYGKVWIK